MTRRHRAFAAFVVAAAMLLAACGGSEQTTATTTAPGSVDDGQESTTPPASAPSVQFGDYTVTMDLEADGTAIAESLGLTDISGAKATDKEGNVVLVSVGGQLPPGTAGDEATLKDALTKIAGGGTPEPISIAGQPGWGISHDGKAYLGTVDPSGMIQVGYGTGTVQDLLKLIETMQASQPDTVSDAPVAPDAVPPPTS